MAPIDTTRGENPSIIRVCCRVPYPQASQIEALAKQHGISSAMVARILITKAIAAGITV